MRKASFGPAAIAVATLLTVFASVGLHPEPADAGLGVFADNPLLHDSRDAVRYSGAHACQICLAHRTMQLTCRPDVVFDSDSAVFSAIRI